MTEEQGRMIYAIVGIAYNQVLGRKQYRGCYVASWREGASRCTIRYIQSTDLSDIYPIVNYEVLTGEKGAALGFSHNIAGGPSKYPREVYKDGVLVAKVEQNVRTVLEILVCQGDVVGLVCTDMTGKVYVYKNTTLKRLASKYKFSNIKSKPIDSNYDYLDFEIPVKKITVQERRGESSVKVIDNKDYKIEVKLSPVGEITEAILLEWKNKGAIHINLPKEVTKLGPGVFIGCDKVVGLQLGGVRRLRYIDLIHLPNLASLSGSEVLEVGYGTLENNPRLRLVSLPKLTKVQEDLFKGHHELGSVIIPSVTEVGDSAFEGCFSLRELVTKDLHHIGARAFKDCKSLTRVYGIIVSIGESAFKGSGLQLFNGTGVLNEVGNNAFESSGLEVLQLKSKPQQMGMQVFKDCKKLRTIIAPVSVKTDTTQFMGCTSLGARSERCML